MTHVILRRYRTCARGFSLVELMVAMTLSLILMAGALSILYSSKLTYTENERIARLQEAGRTVIELILRDARTSGYEGCTRPLDPDQFVNDLNASTSVLWNFAQPAFGYDASSGAWSPALDTTNIPTATPGSDVLVLRTSPTGAPIFRTTSAVTVNSTIPVSRAPNTSVAPDTPLVISDCWGSVVFAATSWADSGTNGGVISHAQGSASTIIPTNASASLTREFRTGAVVMPMQTIIYYVRASANGPALWRKIGGQAPVALVEGVENLQVVFGVGTPASPQATVYRRASAMSPADWNNVVSFTVSVLVRSENPGGVELDQRQYTLLNSADGAVLGPFDDRRQRAVYTTTVVLRNRAL